MKPPGDTTSACRYRAAVKRIVQRVHCYWCTAYRTGLNCVTSPPLQGHFQIIMNRKFCPLFRSRLDWLSRMLYCSGVWSYVINAMTTPIFMAVPIITIWVGESRLSNMPAAGSARVLARGFPAGRSSIMPCPNRLTLRENIVVDVGMHILQPNGYVTPTGA